VQNVEKAFILNFMSQFSKQLKLLSRATVA